MARRGRRPLYWQAWIFAGPGLLVGSVALMLGGLGVLALVLALVAVLLFFGRCLLAPYSKTARRIASPTDEDFARIERFADRLGSVPVFGAIWRSAERLTGNTGRREAESYRRWLRDRTPINRHSCRRVLSVNEADS